MTTLAIDTCFGACSVALTSRTEDGELVHASRFERMDKGHAERLIPMIGEVMAHAPGGFDGIDLIGVTEGPGTFTGVRIGIAAARALSLATGAPVAVMSSLELIARTAAARSDVSTKGREIAVAVDARREEVYFQLFDGDHLASLTEPLLVRPDQAVALLGERGTIIVGSGADILSEAVGRHGRTVSAAIADIQPDARYLGEGIEPPKDHAAEPPRPLYLRPPDAKPQHGKQLARMP